MAKWLGRIGSKKNEQRQCRVRFDLFTPNWQRKMQIRTEMKMFSIGLNFKGVLGDERLKDKWQHTFSYWLKTTNWQMEKASVSDPAFKVEVVNRVVALLG